MPGYFALHGHNPAALLLASTGRHTQRREHGVRRQCSVADESGFTARCEESHLQVVITGVRRQQKCGVAVVELAGDQLHLPVIEQLGIEYYAGRIAGEGLAGKGIDLEDAYPCHGGVASNATRAPISGRMRASCVLKPTRTLTVALERSAVGITAMTLAGISQSG